MGCGNSKVEPGAGYKAQQFDAEIEATTEEYEVKEGEVFTALPKSNASNMEASSPKKKEASVKFSPSSPSTSKKGLTSSSSKSKKVKTSRTDTAPTSSTSQVSKESTKVSSASRHMQSRQENYAKFPIRLIDFDKFKDKARKEIPRYPECKDLVEVFNPESFDHMKSIVVYVSHCWIAGWDGKDEKKKAVLSLDHERNWRGRPHPDNKKNDKYKLICEGVESIWMSMAPTFHKCYLWLDYSCINQDSKSPGQEMEYLDLVMRISDFVMTPVVDIKYDKWKPPQVIGGAAGANWLEAYKAETFKGTRFSYLSRAWCRAEMLFASVVPFADHAGDERLQKFKGALQLNSAKGTRSHFVYGTMENKEGLSGRLLQQPVDAQSFMDTYDPLAGYLTVEKDRVKIGQLVRDIRAYLADDDDDDDDDGGGGGGGFDVQEEDVEIAEGDEGGEEGDGVAEEKTSDQTSSSKSRKKKVSSRMSVSGKGRFKLDGGGFFEGTLRDGQREGFGTASSNDGDSLFRGEYANDQKVSGYEKYPDGCVYEGSYEDNQHHGIGHMTMPNGDTYDGEWEANAMHGIGKYQYASGATSEGFWIDGKLNGKGVHHSKEGNVYEGQFENDRKHGFGEYRWKNGEVYRGEYRDNVRHGHGIYKFKNGDMYDGEWFQDKRTGMGILTYENGAAVYKGEFRDGDFDGAGELDFNGRRFEGTFSANRKHGYGSLKYKNGNIYLGSFVNDKREGDDCRLIYASDHCEYIGRFKDDAMHGLGLYKYANGDTYQGEFKAGKRHGRGKKTVAATGETITGLWSEDKFVKAA